MAKNTQFKILNKGPVFDSIHIEKYTIRTTLITNVFWQLKICFVNN